MKAQDLSERTGLSKPYLSRIEGGECGQRRLALSAVARAYDVFLSLFESEPEAEERAVTRSYGLQIQRGNGLLYAALSAGEGTFDLQPFRVIVPAECEGDDAELILVAAAVPRSLSRSYL